MIAALIRLAIGTQAERYHGPKDVPWRYVLTEDFRYYSRYLEGVTYVDLANPWVAIRDSEIIISKGYAWDGCSPKMKWPLLGIAHLGVPDGPWHLGNNPTYHASLVHDALCQYRHLIPITKTASVALFEEKLALTGWRYRKLYVWAVRTFGPQVFKGDI